MTVDANSNLTKGRKHLLFGRFTAWSIVVICVIYAGILLAGGVVYGLPKEPYFAIAEVLTIISAIMLVILAASIHAWASTNVKIYSLLGLGWMFVMAGITITVHISELTVARQLDRTARVSLSQVFDFEWPSLLYGIEFVAWHVGLGLSAIFLALVFKRGKRELIVKSGLLFVGFLCLLGLVGPAVGNMNWRLIGVFGYVVVLPITCIVLVGVFNKSLKDK